MQIITLSGSVLLLSTLQEVLQDTFVNDTLQEVLGDTFQF